MQIQLLVWTSSALSVANAFSVLTCTRHYRLFEANIESDPGTPSASRVRVQTAPVSNSPLRFLNSLVRPETAEARAHPDSSRDVWELAVWDPQPAPLALLSFFSPLHILIYMFELPLDPLESRPAFAVFKCLVLQVALSTTMHFLQSKNDQKIKDNAIIQKEVFHEYDSKFVQPRLHPIVRDMGTQVSMDAGTGAVEKDELVERGTPTALIQRTFQTHPNSNYIKHIDPNYAGRVSAKAPTSKAAATPQMQTPANKPTRYSDAFAQASSSLARPRQSMPVAATPVFVPAVANTPARMTNNPFTQPTIPTSASLNFGGSMGVYTHVNSPLKKAISMNDINRPPRNSRELAAIEQRELAEEMVRRHTPARKENQSKPSTETKRSTQSQEMSSPPVPFNPFSKARSSAYKYERFPSRW